MTMWLSCSLFTVCLKFEGLSTLYWLATGRLVAFFLARIAGDVLKGVGSSIQASRLG